MSEIRSGFLTIIGPANAGKSTLLNSLLKTHLNIVSSRPQTTRNNIAGILTDKSRGIQLVITDTPGILKKSKSLLDEHLQGDIERSIKDTDIVLFLLPVEDHLDRYDSLLQGLKNKKVIVALNKVDKGERELTEAEKAYGFETIRISGLKGTHLDTLLDKVEPLVTEKAQYYPEDMLSDRTERFFAREYVREAILNHLKDEIPHQIFVEIDEMKEDDRLYRIEGTIFIERENHKKIVIGKKGAMIKQIGIVARKKLETLLNKQVFLRMVVKVQHKWRQDPNFLKRLEYY